MELKLQGRNMEGLIQQQRNAQQENDIKECQRHQWVMVKLTLCQYTLTLLHG